MKLILGDKNFEIMPMILKDHKKNKPLLQKVDELSGLPDDNQYKALVTLLSRAANMMPDKIEENFNLEMAKVAIVGYLGLNGVTFNIYRDINGVIELHRVETGSIIVDRNGVEHPAHSVMLKDMDKLRELLPKIDSIITVNNVLNLDENGEYTDEAYDAVMELLQMTLNESREEIEIYLDAEFARKAIKVCLDLPMAG